MYAYVLEGNGQSGSTSRITLETYSTGNKESRYYRPSLYLRTDVVKVKGIGTSENPIVLQ